MVKNPAANAGDGSLIPGLGFIPWKRKWQYSCLENPMDRGAWQATVHGPAKSRTQLSDQQQFQGCQFNHYPMLSN